MRILTDFFNGIEKGKKATLPMLIIFIVFYGCFGVSISLSDISETIWLTILPLMVICLMLSALFRGKHLLMIVSYLISNTAGILLHFFIEYGETTIQRDFNVISLLVHVIIIPLAVIIGSVIVQIGMIHINKEN